MKITQTFKFHFEIDGNKYDFAIDAADLDEAKMLLATHLAVMIEQVKA